MSLIKSDFVIYLTGRIPYLGKFLLLSFNSKDFQKIRLQDTLIITTSWWNYWITGIQACPSLHITAGGAQRLLKTNSFTENSIEWKMMWKKRAFMHFKFINYDSESSRLIRLRYLLIIWKFARITAALSLHVGRCSDHENVREKWDLITSLNFQGNLGKTIENNLKNWLALDFEHFEQFASYKVERWF